MSIPIVILSVLMQIQLSPTPGVERTPTPNAQRIEIDSRQAEESERAGDPIHPAPRNLPQAEVFLQTAISEMARQERGLSTFLKPSAPDALAEESCESITEGPAGVLRNDNVLNGHRTLARCGGVIVDVLEFDYRPPLRQRVFVHIPEAAVNANFGPGRAMARYYVIENREYATALSWYDGDQEVRLFAVGAYEPDPATINDVLQRIMRVIVQGRLGRES